MKRLYAVLAAVLLLAGCSTLEKLSETKVPVSAIITAANGVDAATTLASSYIRYCTPVVQPAGCSDEAIGKMIPAVRSARVARDAAEQFLADNPDAKFGPATLTDAISKANAALQSIEAQYQIKGAK